MLLLADLLRILMSLPGVLPDVFFTAIPYAIDFVLFATFVVWNGGIVLGLTY